MWPVGGGQHWLGEPQSSIDPEGQHATRGEIIGVRRRAMLAGETPSILKMGEAPGVIPTYPHAVSRGKSR